MSSRPPPRRLGRQKNVCRKHLEDVFKTCLEDASKMSLENIFKTLRDKQNVDWEGIYTFLANLYLRNLYLANLYLTNLRQISGKSKMP